MPIRITGMNSGLDTESIIAELVKAKSASKDKLVKSQTKLQWKQDAWKELNSKIYSFYSKTLSNMRLKSDYYKKTTKVSDEKAATVITGGSAVNGVQTLKIDSLAKSGYLTGGQLQEEIKENGVGTGKYKKASYNASTTLKSMGVAVGESITIKSGDKKETLTVGEGTTINDLVNTLKKAGVNASFDEKNQRFFVSSKETGAKGDFDITGDAAKALGLAALNVEEKANYEKYCEYNSANRTYELKSEYKKYILSDDDSDNVEYKDGKYVVKDTADDAAKAQTRADELNEGLAKGMTEEVLNKAVGELNKTAYGATKIDGQDAKITLNGAEFTSDSNTFEINGLTITANKVTDGEITLTTADDTEGIYNMIKDFLKEYNELINEMDKLYNADSSKGYEPLTDEEKEELSEKEIEKWEEKIKNSILRRDSTLSSVATAMKQVMAQGFNMKDDKGNAYKDKNGNDYGQTYLSEFGIATLGYFTSKDNEKNAYHIDGDSDDASTNTNADKLKTAIANDPEKVVNFFSGLAMNLYNKVGDLMKKTEYSSSFTVYDDVAMKNEYNDFTSKIKKQEERIKDFEDRYYKKFSAMETAMAKMQSKQNAISGLIGM